MRGKKTENLPDGENTPQKHRRTGGLRRPWQEGESGNSAGRPKGSRNKLSEQFFEKLCADWQKGGAEAIAKARQEQPAVYLRVVASLMPKEQKLENEYAHLTDEQIEQRIRELDAAIAAELGNARPNEGDGETEPSRQAQSIKRAHCGDSDMTERTYSRNLASERDDLAQGTVSPRGSCPTQVRSWGEADIRPQAEAIGSVENDPLPTFGVR